MDPPAPMAPRVSGNAPIPQQSLGVPTTDIPTSSNYPSVGSDSASLDSHSLTPSLSSLRTQVMHALAQNSPASAVFFADALVTLASLIQTTCICWHFFTRAVESARRQASGGWACCPSRIARRLVFRAGARDPSSARASRADDAGQLSRTICARQLMSARFFLRANACRICALEGVSRAGAPGRHAPKQWGRRWICGHGR